MTLYEPSTFPQRNNGTSLRGVWWQHVCAAMAIVAGVAAQNVATAQSTPDYVYFMDAFTPTNVQNTPAGIAVIGETEATGTHARSTLTAGGRIVGTQTEFNGTSNITWTHALNTLFNSTAPDLSTSTLRQQFALQILAASGISADPPVDLWMDLGWTWRWIWPGHGSIINVQFAADEQPRSQISSEK